MTAEGFLKTRKNGKPRTGIARKCLAHDCKKTFIAPTRFIRLCEKHRKNT